jgi:Zn-dependent peptidase ImmA (M78 family)
MNANEIEFKAQEILGDLNLSVIPVRVEEVAKKHGIQISDAPSKEFSGILIRKDGKSLLGVNSSESEARQRFTIAHELGHYFLHSNRDVFVEFVEHRETSKPGKKDRKPRDLKETQANVFAAALLMPREQLEKDFISITKNGILDDHHLEILAEKYDVSPMAMNFRILNLKLPQG